MAMHGGMGMAMPGAPPTRVVALDEMLELNELTDQVTFDEIKEDMGDECSNFGASRSPPQAKLANRNAVSFGWKIAHAAGFAASAQRLYPAPRDTRTTRQFGICPSFKEHFLSPRPIRNFSASR